MQPTTPGILDPQTLAALAQQISGGSDQSQPTSTQNLLQLYNTVQSRVAQGPDRSGSFGPAPTGMSQSQWNGLCEAYAEQQEFGHTGMYSSASAAAQHYAQTGQLQSDISKARPGDLVYFYDPNQPNGHVGIIGNQPGTFTSATYNGVQTNPLQAWTQSTGQQILGFVPMRK